MVRQANTEQWNPTYTRRLVVSGPTASALLQGHHLQGVAVVHANRGRTVALQYTVAVEQKPHSVGWEVLKYVPKSGCGQSVTILFLHIFFTYFYNFFSSIASELKNKRVTANNSPKFKKYNSSMCFDAITPSEVLDTIYGLKKFKILRHIPHEYWIN